MPPKKALCLFYTVQCSPESATNTWSCFFLLVYVGTADVGPGAEELITSFIMQLMTNPHVVCLVVPQFGALLFK